MKNLVLYALFVFSLSIGGSTVLEAAEIHVTTTEDLVPGSLRAAITQANTNGQDNVIILPAGTYILSGSAREDENAGGDLDITTTYKLSIQGAGADVTIIDANQIDRVFHIIDGDLEISDSTIMNGSNGGIFLANENWETKTLKLTMNNCHVKYNNVSGIRGDGAVRLFNCAIHENRNLKSDGGGIHLSFGLLYMIHCTVNDNYAGDSGGAVQVEDCDVLVSGCTIINNHAKSGGGGFSIHVCHPKSVVLENSTISGNTAGHLGGGVFNWDFMWSLGTVAIRNCTIYNNEAAIGNGVYGTWFDWVDENRFTIENSIIAGSTADSETGDVDGTIDFVGYNLIGMFKKSDYTEIHFSETDIVGTPENPIDPMLAPLADNGGPTKTLALLPGSPAIDAGYSPEVTTDQRGFMRPVDIPGVVNKADGSDIGAFEIEASLQISGAVSYHDHPLRGVLLSFSNNGGTAETDENGEYSHAVPWNWSGTVTPNLAGFTFSPASKSYTDVNSILKYQDYIADASVPPRLACNRTSLHFGADKAGNESDSQPITISNDGGGILYWTATCSESWLSCTPDSGIGDMVAQVSVNTSGMSPGTYNGTLTFEDLYADNSPLSIPITLTIYQFGSVHFPFGYVDAPESGSVVSGSIPVTGWALDNIGIRRVSVFREPVEGEENELAFIDNATFIAGARPDVETQFPGYPDNFKAGWGYMLLTNFLPSHGNGPMVLHIIAEDMEGNTVELGTRTIICDNANAVKPFGAIDTPAAGSTISGSQYVNFGWALTPVPNTIPFDGSTINVYLDGMPLGHPVYNRYRQDIATLFPGYNNSDGAVGYFYLDTTAYENGVHTIAWSVTDDAGNTEGIGSRYFNIFNSSSTSRRSTVQCLDLYRKNISIDGKQRQAEVNRMGRLEYPLFKDSDWMTSTDENHCYGYLLVSGEYRQLPPGSFIDRKSGIFYWHPGSACWGEYKLIFFSNSETAGLRKLALTVTVK